MIAVRFQSRKGNLLLAVIGLCYAVAAMMIFIWYVVDTWSAASLRDRALQMALLISSFAGAWFVQTALASGTFSNVRFLRRAAAASS